jgi:hypothetical protein
MESFPVPAGGAAPFDAEISKRRAGPVGIAGAPSQPNISGCGEGGVSFWLPGQFGSLAATPTTSVNASGSTAAAREIQTQRFPATANVNLNLNLNAQGDLMLPAPTYTFATPVLGGQLAVGVTGLFGRSAAGINGTLTASAGPFTTTRMGSLNHIGRRSLSDDGAEVECWRAQLHDLCDRRYSRWRL